MGVSCINKTDARLAWPETKQGKSASAGEASQTGSGPGHGPGKTGSEPAQSLGAWRKNWQHDGESPMLDAGEAASLLKATAPRIAQTPKNQLTGLQDVIDRYWINPGYY